MLNPPTLGELSTSLTRVVGLSRSHELLESALQATGVSSASCELCVSQLASIARWIATQKGVVSLVGTSMAIRCESIVALRELGRDGHDD